MQYPLTSHMYKLPSRMSCTTQMVRRGGVGCWVLDAAAPSARHVGIGIN
jgi:hypothetical protein